MENTMNLRKKTEMTTKYKPESLQAFQSFLGQQSILRLHVALKSGKNFRWDNHGFGGLVSKFISCQAQVTAEVYLLVLFPSVYFFHLRPTPTSAGIHNWQMKSGKRMGQVSSLRGCSPLRNFSSYFFTNIIYI